MEKKINVGILGAGHIAADMAKALNGIADKVNLYAVASRSLQKAESFAREWNFEIAYGSYEELARDEQVDLIYIATPHSEHFGNAKLCLENGRNCLVEKAFCANHRQAIEIINLAKNNNCFLAEAMWTRYQPSCDQIGKLIEEGTVGKIASVYSEFSVPIMHVERLKNPSLAGGALLDLGVYSLSVLAMYINSVVESVSINMKKMESGVDETTIVKIQYAGGIIGEAKCSASEGPTNFAKITGDKGHIIYGPINVPQWIEIYNDKNELVERIEPEISINGYEYEVLECRQAILEGKQETVSMPLSETIRMMKWMDYIRHSEGIFYPFETASDTDVDLRDAWH